jgi:hypothetical protein
MKRTWSLAKVIAGIFCMTGAAAAFDGTVCGPNGWKAEVYTSNIYAACALRRAPDGGLLVGNAGQVVHVAARTGMQTVRASGSFNALNLAVRPDGTLFIADSTDGDSRLLSVAAGSTDPQSAVTGFTYCQGVAALRDGDVIVSDAGWIGYSDGRVLRLPAGVSGINASMLAPEITTSTFNPHSIEMGPDGMLYVVDRGAYGTRDGRVYRWMPGSNQAEVYVEGLNDPFDMTWLPDGSMLVTDYDYTSAQMGIVYRFDPATRGLTLWAKGFTYCMGIETGPAGDVFVSDVWVSTVYRFSMSVTLPVRITPRVFNLKQHGRHDRAGFMARFTSTSGADLKSISVTGVNGSSVTAVRTMSARGYRSGFTGWFSSREMARLLKPGWNTVRFQGRLADGTAFEATGRAFGSALKGNGAR